MTNATALPSPFNSPDCVLHGMPCILMNAQHIRDSTLENEPLGLALRAQAVSWHQEPAGSLPGTERHLARALGFGTDARSLRRLIKAGALRDWVMCNDGRLYHAEVCAKARAAREMRLRQVAQTEAARKARHAEAPQAPPAEPTQPAAPPVPDDVPPIIAPSSADDRPVIDASSGDDLEQVVEIVKAPPSVTEPVTGSYLTKVVVEEDESEVSPLRDSRPAPPPEPPSADAVLFKVGLPILAHLLHVDVDRARPFMAKLRQTIGNKHSARLFLILQQTLEEPPIDPKGWLIACCQGRAAKRQGAPHETVAEERRRKLSQVSVPGYGADAEAEYVAH
jgi:hypothetical protein